MPKEKDWLLDNPHIFYCTHVASLPGEEVERDSELERIVKGSLKRCEQCWKEMSEYDEALRSIAPLRGLEIFAG